MEIRSKIILNNPTPDKADTDAKFYGLIHKDETCHIRFIWWTHKNMQNTSCLFMLGQEQ